MSPQSEKHLRDVVDSLQSSVEYYRRDLARAERERDEAQKALRRANELAESARYEIVAMMRVARGASPTHDPDLGRAHRDVCEILSLSREAVSP